MARSNAATVSEYLDELPPERRADVAAVREVVLEHLPDGYEETMRWGMISYELPLAAYPDTYNGEPLGYVGLGAQKRHFSLYLYGVYMDPAQEAALREAFAAEGKKPDMGKSCLRFRRAEDLPLDAVGRLVAAVPPDRLIEMYEAARRG